MIRAIPAAVAGLCLLGALSACGSGDEHSEHGTEAVTVTATTTGAATTTAVTVTPSTPAGAAGPAFDCSKAGSEAEKMVCDDPGLAALDRELADEYGRALDRAGADKAALEGTQNGWVSGRDDCWKADDKRACIEDAYRTRIFELRTSDPAVPVPPVVTYSCPGDKPFTAQFYDGFDPKIAVLTWGEDSAVTFAEPSGSGTKYGRQDVEFWEHRGEATVDFYGNEFTCRTN